MHGWMAAQSNIRMSNYWLDAFFINPAALDGALSPLRIAAGHRSQWVNFEGAPRTYLLAGAYYHDEMRSQFGLHAVFDQIGYTSTIDAGLAYAYSARWNNLDLNMGLSFRYQRLAYDWAQARMETSMIDPALFALAPQVGYNADVGLELVWPYHGLWIIGLSSRNLLSLFQTVMEPFANTNFIYGRYRSNHGLYYFDRQKRTWDFSVAITVIHSRTADSPNVLQEECNANIHFNLASNVLTAGLLYRTTSEAGLIIGFERGAFNLSCVYEYPLQYAREGMVHPMGTVEAILIYKLNNRRPSPCGRRDGRPCTGTL